MNMEQVNIHMLGGFSVTYGASSVNDSANRMRKVWLLLAYLVLNRGRVTTQENYLTLLRGAGGEESADPNGKLKAMFYRVRTMLNSLEETAGHQWIVRKNGTYCWNEDISVTVDTEVFESLCRTAADTEDTDKSLALYTEALTLYSGDFLPKLNMEPWVIPLSAYYHQMYLTAAQEALGLMKERGLWREMAALCEKALKIEPYSEELYCFYMRALLALDKRQEAVHAYEEMSENLFATFGVMPSDEARTIYREASREASAPAVPTATVREQLREQGDSQGALLCEYDLFKLVYQMQARSIARSGEVVHIALFSLRGYRNKELARRSLDVALNNLEELLLSNLRQGDLVCRCSASQLVVMLPQANYENSVNVCRRIEKAFERKFPHSPAQIHFSVQPLEPRERAKS